MSPVDHAPSRPSDCGVYRPPRAVREENQNDGRVHAAGAGPFGIGSPKPREKIGVKLYGRVRNYFAVLTPPFTSEYETITVFDVPSVMFPIETVFSMVNMPL